MEYLVRLAQCHETFRVPELQAVAQLLGIDLEIVSYHEYTPHCVIKVKDEAAASALISRTILSRDIMEIWGQGATYEELHADVKRRCEHRWPEYRDVSFSFAIDGFCGKRSHEKKVEIIQSFAYLDLQGEIRMKNPDTQFCVIEEYVSRPEQIALGTEQSSEPRKIFMGRLIAQSARKIIDRYDLKKRKYISTTSMDAELSLVTANMALAAPGKVFYDPFVGTGSFLVAASHFGASTMGSDIDPRSFRGKDKLPQEDMALVKNFKQYNIADNFLDAFSSDLTNTPLRNCEFLDGIVCDPPTVCARVFGFWELAMVREGYVPPKRPYGFEALQRDVLDFAARTLVPHGRLAMWMPTGSDEDVHFPVPMHPNLEVVNVSVQPFSNWSRRLITYRRLPEGEISDTTHGRAKTDALGTQADELNAFRQKVCV
ncbi:tRNA (guanine(10)-N2)-methyltransferase [Penicillium macrosclerotiorum]|uniref:tRNA (guanine(10)-N2)-methyltransferase n=1 Tax=Penicillium macrosclerotiorum TaxID=303699 RepID=UPI0025466CBF|nr:tRNA (guanine(10)-N2)-methyltransferase [Penicillium macrosclerotiorum]KAJ5679431.1 tRNA (guanine(10)-N2)-methyltransferase [Penicillium macrosclerotiorum]